MAKRKHKSTRKSAERVKELLGESYEAGRQDKCKLAVYRNKIKPLTGISERTFWRYMNDVENEVPSKPSTQMKLFD